MSMETTRFDQMTRTFSRTGSRRAALSALLAGAVMPLLHPDAGAKRLKSKGQAPRPPRGTPCDVCEKDCPYSRLQPAIDDAKAGATIRICKGTYTSNPTITINKRLTLVGVGGDDTVLKGGGFVRVLQIGPSGVVTMQGLTVTGGVERLVPRGGGAGILVLDRGALTLERCRVEDNLAAEGGGVAVSRGASLTLIGSTVSENTALTVGGGVLVRSGGTATLETGSRVTDNEARVWGGGMLLEQNATLLLKDGSRVEENTARFFGGGIFAGRNSTLTLEAGSRVTDNDAGDEGGGLFNDRATVAIANTSIVRDNDPDNCAGISGLQTANCINDD